MKNDAAKLNSFLKQVTPLFETYGKKNIVIELAKAISLTEESTAVLLCGEFKRGKSSLVNAILGSELCPTDIGIATSVVTIIKYGAVKKAVRYYGDLLEEPESLKIEEIEWSDIEKYTMGDVLEIDNTILIELSYPAPFLKGGITIIDTPGIGGLDPRHAVLTHMALPKADVVLFVTDAGEPLTQSELNFYESKILPCGKQCVVLVNKSDILTKDTLTTHLNNTKLQLAKLGSSIVVPVSAKCWELFNKLQDNDLLLSSNKDSVLAAIASNVEEYKRTQYKKYRDILVAEINDVSKTVFLEIEQLKKSAADQQNALEELHREQLSLNKFRGELNNPTSQIRLNIDAVFEDARNDVQHLLSHEGTILTSTEFDTLLNSEMGLENDGKWLVAQINQRLQTLSSRVDDRIEVAFGEISENIEKEIACVINSETILVSNEVKSCDVINSQLAFSLAGKVMTGSMIGGAATIITELLIPGIGIIAGIATAAALIWRQVSKEAQQQKRNSLRMQVLPKINLAITDMRNQTNVRFSKFHQNLLMTLQAIIAETEEKMKVLQNSIQEKKSNDRACLEKITELEQKAKYCETLIAQMNLLYSNPFSNA